MRFLLAVIPLLAAALAAFLFGVPLVDRIANRTAAPSTPTVPPAAGEFRAVVRVADLHCDALLWNRSLVTRATRGHVDLPRLRAGGFVLQVFSTVTSFPLGANYRRTPHGLDLVTILSVCNRWPSLAWRSPLERAFLQAEALRAAAAASQGRLVLIESAAGLASVVPAPDDATGALLSIEGLHGTGGDIAAIDRLFAAGFRIFGLVHMTDTDIAGSAHGWKKGGLTAFGHKVVARIDSLGGIVDLAHASPSTIGDVLDAGIRRVMVSHTGVDGTCPGNRNLSDHDLTRIAAAGGIVGIGFWEGAVCGDDAGAIARAIRHAADTVGVQHVALGSDFDGAVATPFDAAGVSQLIPALAAEGFADGEIAEIMAGNALRFFAETLPRD